MIRLLTLNSLSSELNLVQSMASPIPPGLELTPIAVLSLTASLVISSDDNEIKSWDGQCSTLSNKNECPFCHDKWSMYAIEWSELLCQLGFGMKVHKTNEPMRYYCVWSLPCFAPKRSTFHWIVWSTTELFGYPSNKTHC